MSPYYHKDYKTNILPTLMDFVKLFAGSRLIPPPLFLVSQTVGDSALGQVVGGEFDFDAISGENFDVVAADFAGDVSKHVEPVVEVNPKHGVGERVCDCPFHFNQILFRQGNLPSCDWA
jgi:hypothetical protein